MDGGGLERDPDMTAVRTWSVVDRERESSVTLPGLRPRTDEEHRSCHEGGDDYNRYGNQPNLHVFSSHPLFITHDGADPASPAWKSSHAFGGERALVAVASTSRWPSLHMSLRPTDTEDAWTTRCDWMPPPRWAGPKALG